MLRKVVLVTGANKGIGYEIVKSLAEKKDPSYRILLGSRSAENAKEALGRLEKETKLSSLSHVVPLIVDLNDEKTIEAAAATVKKDYGGLDILINNAGMAFKGSVFNEEVARTTIGTNYHGTFTVSKHFLPLVKENGRVVNVSSGTSSSALNNMSAELRAAFMSESLSKSKLDELLAKFTDDVAKGTWKTAGWPGSCYGMSKVGVSMLTRMQARDNKTKGVLINAADPGWCRTDMAGPSAPLSSDEGARRVLVPALLSLESTTTGNFYVAGKVTSWHS